MSNADAMDNKSEMITEIHPIPGTNICFRVTYEQKKGSWFVSSVEELEISEVRSSREST